MKNKTFILFAILFSACDNNGSTINKTQPGNSSNASVQTISAPKNVSVKDMITGYLKLKNALANDNGNDAANAGKLIMLAADKFDKTSLSADQKKRYDAVADDIKENAEHCSTNGNKIAHQREHFDMLSQDMYELIKAFPEQQTLYRDYCPMYNDGKGAMWISEIKEIKNPYLGKKMLQCGEVKEEIK